MTSLTQNDLIVPFLDSIRDGNVHAKADVVEKLAVQFNLTDTERNDTLETGRKRFDNLIDWCHALCTESKFTENFGGGIRITKRGLHELTENRDEINVAYIRTFK